jgi:hypothetical protein
MVEDVSSRRIESPGDTHDSASVEHAAEPDDERYAAVRQYSLAQILGVWAAAAVPMGVLAWSVAPWLKD